MDWKPAPVYNSWGQIHKGQNPTNKGVYWVQSRGELAHLQVRYHSAYWNGLKWVIEAGSAVYWWAVIEPAEEPENPRYYDELGRLNIVAAFIKSNRF